MLHHRQTITERNRIAGVINFEPNRAFFVFNQPVEVECHVTAAAEAFDLLDVEERHLGVEAFLIGGRKHAGVSLAVPVSALFAKAINQGLLQGVVPDPRGGDQFGFDFVV